MKNPRIHIPCISPLTVIFQTTLLCFLSLFLVACSEKIPELPGLSVNAKILAFGDSLTYGTGAKDTESYPAVLQDLINKDVINAGNPGEISSEGLERLPSLLERYQPDLVILCHGGNDLLRKKDPDKTASNLREMISLIRSHGSSVILLGVPNPKLFLLSTAELYPTLAKDFDTPIEAQIIPAVLGDNSLKSDAIHPNADGYRKIAEAVYNLMIKARAI